MKLEYTQLGDDLPSLFANLDQSLEKWPQSFSRKAGVAVLFLPKEKSLAMIRRSFDVGSHRGQVGFAGGMQDPGEDNPMETIAREVNEELGVPRKELHFHGALPLVESQAGSAVVPMVVSTYYPVPNFKVSKDEVEELLIIPWNCVSEEASETFRFNMFGKWRSSDLYKYRDNMIWGLSARIIKSMGLIYKK